MCSNKINIKNQSIFISKENPTVITVIPFNISKGKEEEDEGKRNSNKNIPSK